MLNRYGDLMVYGCGVLWITGVPPTPEAEMAWFAQLFHIWAKLR